MLTTRPSPVHLAQVSVYSGHLLHRGPCCFQSILGSLPTVRVGLLVISCASVLVLRRPSHPHFRGDAPLRAKDDGGRVLPSGLPVARTDARLREDVLVQDEAPLAPSDRTRVGVVDDHWSICVGVITALSRKDGAIVAGSTAATVRELLEQERAAPERADVVLLDLELRDGTTPQGNLSALREAGYPVVIYTAESRAHRLQGTLGSGARAVVGKNDDEGALLDAVRAVKAGEDFVSPLMATIFLAAKTRPRLTRRQEQALRLFAQGLTARQVARAMGITEGTVRNHVDAVRDAYRAAGDDVASRVDLLRVAVRDGYVGPDAAGL